MLRHGGEIGYGYDAAGNLTSLAPPGRPAHTFVYNALGLDSIYDPPDVPGLAEDRTFYSYNADRELTRILRPDGLAVDFAYDSAGRVDSIASPGGILDYQYSPTTGQLTGSAAPGGEALSFAYDGALPTRETWTGTVSGQVGFAYDNDFRLSGLAVNGDTVAYGYDGDGLLTTAGAMVLNRDPLNGALTSTALGAVTTRHGYDPRGLLSGDSAWVSGVLTFARTYQRDPLGRITAVEDLADGVTTLWEYGYDAAGRLETVTRDGVAYASYTYDANGNRLTRTSGAGVETGVYDAQDRMTSYAGAEYTYSANGELETKIEGADTTRYDYDVFGNLTRVDLPDGTVIEYVIDGRNRRVGKKVNGVLVQGFLYGDQLNPVAELDGAGNVVTVFVYGSKPNVPQYMTRGGETFRVLSDHLGSVRMVVDLSTGAVVQRLSYDAWGRVLEDTNPSWQPFGFAGGIWTAETGSVRFGARDFDIRSGRWTGQDGIGFRGRTSNLYAYAAEDPVNYLDLNGYQGIPGFVIGAVSGAIGGAVTGGVGGALVGAVVGAAAGFIWAPASYQAAAVAGATASALGQGLGIFMTNPDPAAVLDLDNYDPFAIAGAAVGAGIGFGVARAAGGAAQAAVGNAFANSLAGPAHAANAGAITETVVLGLSTGVGEACFADRNHRP